MFILLINYFILLIFASFWILATISFDSFRTAFLGATFLVLDIPVAFEAIPLKFSLIFLLEFVLFFFGEEIVNVFLTVSYINLASLTLVALSNVSTTRSFCDSDKVLALKILLTYNNLEFKRLTSLSSP